MYLRRANREFDPLAARARDAALASAPGAGTAEDGVASGRFRRGGTVEEPVTPSATSEEVPRR
jgi:hypothetical protein